MLTPTPDLLLKREHNDAVRGPVTMQIVFTEGDCWRLALAMRDLLGAPLIFVCAGDEPGKPYDMFDVQCEWTHALVQVGDDAFLDIDGIRTKEDLLRSVHAAPYHGTGWLFQDQDKMHYMTDGFSRDFSMDDSEVAAVAAELCALHQIAVPVRVAA